MRKIIIEILNDVFIKILMICAAIAILSGIFLCDVELIKISVVLIIAFIITVMISYIVYRNEHE